MANNKLGKLAGERGVTPEVYVEFVVVPKVNNLGQVEAAKRIGVSQATISSWLKDGYDMLPPHWVKKPAQPKEEQAS